LHRDEIADQDNAEGWWEAVADNKIIARTNGWKYPYDKYSYKHGKYIHPPYIFNEWLAENKLSQYRDLISRLTAEGWEVAVNDERGAVTVMQRAGSA
jgi:hypothetical protein